MPYQKLHYYKKNDKQDLSKFINAIIKNQEILHQIVPDVEVEGNYYIITRNFPLTCNDPDCCTCKQYASF